MEFIYNVKTKERITPEEPITEGTLDFIFEEIETPSYDPGVLNYRAAAQLSEEAKARLEAKYNKEIVADSDTSNFMFYWYGWGGGGPVTYTFHINILPDKYFEKEEEYAETDKVYFVSDASIESILPTKDFERVERIFKNSSDCMINMDGIAKLIYDMQKAIDNARESQSI